MISCSLSPNTEADDIWLAVRVLFSPWKWKRGPAVYRVEQRFGGVAFNSGRSAFLAILKAFEIGKGSEVIVQAFTCVAVPNSIRWAGAKPVFADIDETYTMDPADFERKITDKTKAVIIQHTFGIPAKMDVMLGIARKHHIRVIEDFAHTMSIPMRGDAAFYSFGRDKVLSSVFGGLAVIQLDFKSQILNLKAYQKRLPYPSYGWIFQQLMHPVAFALILPLYSIGIGKLLLVAFQKLHLLSFPVYQKEKNGEKPDVFPARYPNALALLLLKQLKKLERYTAMREEAVRIYGGKGPLLRFPLRADDPEKMIHRMKENGVLLGNWYHRVVDPVPVGYTPGSCPVAEDAAKHIVNLPTRIYGHQAKQVLTDL